MVVGQADGHQIANHDLAVAHDGLRHRAAQAENGDFGFVDDRCEVRAADAALVGNGERATLQFVAGDFAFARLGGERFQFLGQLDEILLIHVTDDGDDQAELGVHRDADVNVVLEHDFLRGFIQAGIEDRIFLQRVGHGFKYEARHGQPRAFFLVGLDVFFPQGQQGRDVRVVELRDVRDGVPVFDHAPADDLAQR